MGISIAEIKNETLQKLANSVDADNNGVINQEESVSLFEKINAEEQKYNKSLEAISNKGKNAAVIAGGAVGVATITGGALRALNAVPFKGFSPFLGILCLATGIITKKVAENSWENKLMELETANAELKALLQNNQNVDIAPVA